MTETRASTESEQAIGADLGPSRNAINRYFHRHELADTLVMAVLALVYVGLGALQDQAAQVLSKPIADAIAYAIAVIFVVEFAVRLYAAPLRLRYFRGHWFDLLAVLPTLGFLRLLGLGRLAILIRLLRIARLGIITHSLIDANRAAGRLSWINRHNGVHTLLLTAFGFVWVGAGLAYELEHGVNPQFGTFWDSVWWAFSTMATLGYGNGPMTLGGRMVAGVLMILGIACFGALTASATTFFVERTEKVREYSSADLMDALRRIEVRIESLEQEVGVKAQKVGHT